MFRAVSRCILSGKDRCVLLNLHLLNFSELPWDGCFTIFFFTPGKTKNRIWLYTNAFMPIGKLPHDVRCKLVKARLRLRNIPDKIGCQCRARMPSWWERKNENEITCSSWGLSRVDDWWHKWSRTSQVVTSTSFNFNFIRPTWTNISSFDGSTFNTIASLLKAETCTVSPSLGSLACFSAMEIGKIGQITKNTKQLGVNGS